MKLYSVQYLRGLAALLVVVAHALDGVQISFARLGGLGVALFFVISGFIIVMICGEDDFSQLRFYQRRLYRVAPLYWLATLLIAIAAVVQPSLFKNTEFTVNQLVLSLLFVPHYRPNGEIVPLLKLGWTLNLEMFFYVCFGLCSGFKATSRVWILSIAFLSLAVAGAVFDFHNAILRAYTTSGIVGFCIGMWVGLMALRGRLVDGHVPQAAILVLSVVCLVAGFAVFPSRINLLVTVLLASGSAALLLVGLGLERRLPRNSQLALLGDASYSIYLAHMYVIAVTVAVCRHIMPHAPVVIVVAVTVAVGCLAGVATHILVERPMMRLHQRPRRLAQISGAALPSP